MPRGGVTYTVTLTPSSGDVNIAAVSTDAATFSPSIGSSSNAGTTPDTVSFTAGATQRYYIDVSPTNTDSNYSIAVTSS